VLLSPGERAASLARVRVTRARIPGMKQPTRTSKTAHVHRQVEPCFTVRRPLRGRCHRPPPRGTSWVEGQKSSAGNNLAGMADVGPAAGKTAGASSNKTTVATDNKPLKSRTSRSFAPGKTNHRERWVPTWCGPTTIRCQHDINLRTACGIAFHGLNHTKTRFSQHFPDLRDLPLTAASIPSFPYARAKPVIVTTFRESTCNLQLSPMLPQFFRLLRIVLTPRTVPAPSSPRTIGLPTLFRKRSQVPRPRALGLPLGWVRCTSLFVTRPCLYQRFRKSAWFLAQVGDGSTIVGRGASRGTPSRRTSRRPWRTSTDRSAGPCLTGLAGGRAGLRHSLVGVRAHPPTTGLALFNFPITHALHPLPMLLVAELGVLVVGSGTLG